jgi:FAD/FMN-containing dehydrogenase
MRQRSTGRLAVSRRIWHLAMSDPRLQILATQAPGLVLKTAAADLEHYGRDWTRRWTPAPLAVALPASVEEVQAVLRWAAAHDVSVVPSGGRTGLSGGAVAARGELVLSLERMNKVLAFDRVDRLLTVQAGMPLEAVQRAAAEHGLLYPVDFAARGSCSIGGNIATNAGGIRVIRYGNTREWIAGLKVVTAGGEVLELNRGLVKNASGYDLRHLMIGSEGTLGVIIEATLRLTDPAPASQVMLLAVPALDALMQVFEVCRSRLQLGAFEFLNERGAAHVVAHGAQPPFAESSPYYVVTEFDVADASAEEAALAVFEQCLEQGWVTDGVISQSQAQAQALWRLREGITESLAARKPYKNDISVRISAIPAFMQAMQALFERDYPGFEVVWFGHIGDGNLHINVLAPEDMTQDEFIARCEQVTHALSGVLAQFGGSISAEHGIGLVKKPYLDETRGAAEIALMRAVRVALDPAGLLNPGKLFD